MSVISLGAIEPSKLCLERLAPSVTACTTLLTHAAIRELVEGMSDGADTAGDAKG